MILGVVAESETKFSMQCSNSNLYAYSSLVDNIYVYTYISLSIVCHMGLYIYVHHTASFSMLHYITLSLRSLKFYCYCRLQNDAYVIEAITN